MPLIPTSTAARVAWLIALLTFALNLASRLVDIPLNRLFEDNLCRSYYQEHDPSKIPADGTVPEVLCKENAIQESLAYYIGLITTLELVFEMLVSIPLGYVFDTRGRKAVLMVNILCSIVAVVWYIVVASAYNTFPLTAVVGGSFFHLLGGSFNVAGAAMNACLADVAQDATQLTQIFGYTSTVGQLFQLLAPVISSESMKISLWVPFGLGLFFWAAALGIVLLIPETRHLGTKSTARSHILAENDPLLEHGNASQAPTKVPASLQSSILVFLQDLGQPMRSLGRLLRSHKALPILFCIHFATHFGRTVQNILVQYISKRYSFPFSDVGYFFTGKAIVALIVLGFVIPRALTYATETRGIGSREANLGGLAISVICLLLGAIGISFSMNVGLFMAFLALYSLGSGNTIFSLSLIASLIEIINGKSQLGLVFTGVATVETVAVLAANPSFFAAFIQALRMGGYGLGLPWWIAASIYATSCGAVYALWQIPFNSQKPIVENEDAR